MPIEGELVVRIESRDGRVTAASARAERPRVAGRLFPGRLASEAPELAGSLFAICGRSQAIAARSAIEAIRGDEVHAAEREAREGQVAVETLLEHAWRFFVDLPRLAGREPLLECLAEGRRALAALRDAGGAHEARARAAAAVLAWSREEVLGGAPGDFLAIEALGGFTDWMRAGGTPVAAACAQLLAQEAALGASDVALLPRSTDAWVGGALAAAIDRDDAFDERPHVDGAPRETGPLSRVARHPLAAAAVDAWGRGFGARLVARLLETAELLASVAQTHTPRHGATATGNGKSIAWVETARGLLVHRVALEGERIAAYRIVAPTEWNFHPDGAFTRGALGLSAGSADALMARVRLLVASLDPCVGVRYEAGHA